MNKFIVKIACFLLKKELPLKERTELLGAIMDNLEALPLHEVFSENEEGEITVSGKTIDVDKAKQLRAFAESALQNKALDLITEQVAYESFVGGVHKCITPEDLYFYRAALWWGQRVKKHLMFLAGRT